MAEKQTYTINEVSKVLSICRTSIYNWTKRGILPKPIKLGTKVLYNKSDIDKMLNHD
jgi:excisionase family DNA binding protein